jgi:hypothetical protein
MNQRSIILQTGALAFCISIIALSLTGYSLLEIIIISFIVFVIVTLLATVIVSLFFTRPKDNEKKDEDLLIENNGILNGEMNNDKNVSGKNENISDRKEEPQKKEANSTTAKE